MTDFQQSRRSIIASAADGVRRAYVRHRDAAVLRSLSDTALRDIGLDRGSIDHAVRHGRSF